LDWNEPEVVREVESAVVQKKLKFGEETEQGQYQQRFGTPPLPPSAREHKRLKKQTTPKKVKTGTESVGSGKERRHE
jgi:hypothetical protein